MSLTREQLSRRKSERGSVTIMTAVLMVGLVLVVGLSIDVSRIYMIRSGLQNAADAAALAAARELNSGTGGLADAVAQAKSANLTNKYGFNRTGVTAPAVTIAKVEFSTSLAANATWYDNTNGNNVPAGVETSIKYVRVTTQSAIVNTLFAGKVLGATHTEQRTAVAGMSVGLNTICNFFPIAVGLTNYATLTNHQQFTFKFTDGTGGSVTIPNLGYTVLNVPDIQGNGAPETANLAAGITTVSASIGNALSLSNSNSANSSNGPRQIADGTNTRFDSYQNGYANSLNATTYPPDSNVYDNTGTPITGTEYLNRTKFTPPPNHPPGQEDRRVLVMPIVAPGTYSSSSIPIRNFGAFLLRKSVKRNGSGAGDMVVEYLANFVIGCGSFDPGAGGSTLTKPVLYK